MKAEVQPMTAEAFLVWRLDRPGRWELVGGQPILAMAGARRRHERVIGNVFTRLRDGLGRGRCQPWLSGLGVAIPAGNVRQPDLTVDCGPADGDDLVASAPAVVLEVLSPCPRAIDQNLKLTDYQSVSSMRHIVLIDPERAHVAVWSRAGEGPAWTLRDTVGLDAHFALPAVDLTLALADVYADVTLEE